MGRDIETNQNPKKEGKDKENSSSNNKEDDMSKNLRLKDTSGVFWENIKPEHLRVFYDPDGRLETLHDFSVGREKLLDISEAVQQEVARILSDEATESLEGYEKGSTPGNTAEKCFAGGVTGMPAGMSLADVERAEAELEAEEASAEEEGDEVRNFEEDLQEEFGKGLAGEPSGNDSEESGPKTLTSPHDLDGNYLSSLRKLLENNFQGSTLEGAVENFINSLDVLGSTGGTLGDEGEEVTSGSGREKVLGALCSEWAKTLSELGLDSEELLKRVPKDGEEANESVESGPMPTSLFGEEHPALVEAIWSVGLGKKEVKKRERVFVENGEVVLTGEHHFELSLAKEAEIFSGYVSIERENLAKAHKAMCVICANGRPLAGLEIFPRDYYGKFLEAAIGLRERINNIRLDAVKGNFNFGGNDRIDCVIKDCEAVLKEMGEQPHVWLAKALANPLLWFKSLHVWDTVSKILNFLKKENDERVETLALLRLAEDHLDNVRRDVFSGVPEDVFSDFCETGQLPEKRIPLAQLEGAMDCAKVIDRMSLTPEGIQEAVLASGYLGNVASALELSSEASPEDVLAEAKKVFTWLRVAKKGFCGNMDSSGEEFNDAILRAMKARTTLFNLSSTIGLDHKALSIEELADRWFDFLESYEAMSKPLCDKVFASKEEIRLALKKQEEELFLFDQIQKIFLDVEPDKILSRVLTLKRADSRRRSEAIKSRQEKARARNAKKGAKSVPKPKSVKGKGKGTTKASPKPETKKETGSPRTRKPVTPRTRKSKTPRTSKGENPRTRKVVKKKPTTPKKKPTDGKGKK